MPVRFAGLIQDHERQSHHDLVTAEEDEDFVMTVTHVFNITGRGTVVVGDVRSGVIWNAETVEILDGEAPVGTASASITFTCRPGGPNQRDPGIVDLHLTEVDGVTLRVGQTIRRRRQSTGLVG